MESCLPQARGNGATPCPVGSTVPSASTLHGGRRRARHSESLHWLLQQPDVLQREHCFMTIGSRRGKRDGFFDAQAPALWISNGIGRDSPDNRNAPKIGWCWAGNRHTQLGFASATTRIEIAYPAAHNDARTSRTTSSDITTYSAFCRRRVGRLGNKLTRRQRVRLSPPTEGSS
jgi:hypothetical protein